MREVVSLWPGLAGVRRHATSWCDCITVHLVNSQRVVPHIVFLARKVRLFRPMKKKPKVDAGYVTDKRAAEILNVPLSRIRFWVERGVLKGKIQKTAAGRTMVNVRLEQFGKGRGVVSAYAAARLFGLDERTVRNRVKRGMLRGAVRRKTAWKIECRVERASLDKAFVGKCLLCGKEFKTQKPAKSKYCCARHRLASYYIENRTSEKALRPRSYDPRLISVRMTKLHGASALHKV
jgi:hypothetical protein